MTLVAKTGGQGDIHERRVGISQLRAGIIDAQSSDVRSDRATVMPLKHLRQVHWMYTHGFCHIPERERLGKPRVQLFSRLPQPFGEARDLQSRGMAKSLAEDFQDQPFHNQGGCALTQEEFLVEPHSETRHQSPIQAGRHWPDFFAIQIAFEPTGLDFHKEQAPAGLVKVLRMRFPLRVAQERRWLAETPGGMADIRVAAAQNQAEEWPLVGMPGGL